MDNEMQFAIDVPTCCLIQPVKLSTYTKDEKVLFKDIPLNYKIKPSEYTGLKTLSKIKNTDCEFSFFDFIERREVLGIHTIKCCNNHYISFIILMDCSIIEIDEMITDDDKRYEYGITGSRYYIGIKLIDSSKLLLGLFIKNYNKEDFLKDYFELIEIIKESTELVVRNKLVKKIIELADDKTTVEDLIGEVLDRLSLL